MEFFLDELAEVEPAKVAPELLSINSDEDDDSDDHDYGDKDPRSSVSPESINKM